MNAEEETLHEQEWVFEFPNRSWRHQILSTKTKISPVTALWNYDHNSGSRPQIPTYHTCKLQTHITLWAFLHYSSLRAGLSLTWRNKNDFQRLKEMKQTRQQRYVILTDVSLQCLNAVLLSAVLPTFNFQNVCLYYVFVGGNVASL